MQVIHTASKELQDDFDKKYGRFNYAPPNLQEITPIEFFRALDSIPRYTAYKQIRPDMDPSAKKYMDLHMYIFNDGSGVGYTNEWKPKQGLDCWVQTFYKFATCLHDYECTNSRMCYSEHRCKKCGHEFVIDSSD